MKPTVLQLAILTLFVSVALLISRVAITSAASASGNVHNAEVEDNEFAEFEDPDEPPPIGQDPPTNSEQQPSAWDGSAPSDQQQAAAKPPSTPLTSEDDEAASVKSSDEDEDSASYLEDRDEFEGFGEKPSPSAGGSGAPSDKPDLEIAKIPVPLTTNWDSYYLELITLTALAVYFLNFIVGKSKNAKLANAWTTWNPNFTLSATMAKVKRWPREGLMRDSENTYSLWCTGRQHVDGMLVELRFIKRQDLVSLVAKLFRPSNDQLLIKLVLDDSSDWDNFVLAIVQRRRSGQLIRDHSDLSQFCSDRRCQLDGKPFTLPDSLTILAEDAEVAEHVIDRRVANVLKQFESCLDHLIVSDMYSGPRAQQDDAAGGAGGASGGAAKPPDSQRAIVLSLRIGRRVGAATSTSTEEMESLLPLTKMLIYLVDKCRRVRLSKEARSRAEKRREKAAEAAQKLAHSQRQEAAQLRREEKRKAEKERLLLEEDPDRARKLEDREAKREAKRKAPKMKMLKVKGM
uniref:PAT complex subunit CCDC47 n=1 Tax=Macrostomum lignano TaxID=282301 RepID=A0A1I8H0X4_9PLAT